MRRALLFCVAIVFAIACGDSITEPMPDRSSTGGTASMTPRVAFATTTTEDGLSISTDKDDYQPGDVVHFTGYGWQPEDVLDIVLTDDPLTHEPHTWTVEVGVDGMFHDQTYIVDEGDLDVAFTLVATSRATGRSLTVRFTDSNPGVPGVVGQNPNPVPSGTQATYTVTIGFAGNAQACTVNLGGTTISTASATWPAAPSGGFFSFNPSSVSGSGGQTRTSTLTVTTPVGMAPDTYQFRVTEAFENPATGCNGNPQNSAIINLVVGPPADQTRPTVTVNQAVGQNDPTNASPINFTVVFSEAVTDFTAPDVTLSGAGAAGASAAVSGTGPTYTVAVSGMTTTGPVTASIAANKAQDAAGNLNEASTSTDNTVVYDKDGPKVTINQKSDQPDPTNQSPIKFTVIFDKPVSDFANADVTLGGTAHPTTAVVSGGSDGMNFEVAVSGMTGDGTVTATIAADVAHDLAGNGNMAGSSTDNEVTYDTTEPTVTINQATGQADPTNASSINFTVVFSEPVSGFLSNDLTLDGTAPGTKTALVSTTDPELKTYTVAVSGMSGDGTVTAAVKAGAADDEATNHSTASTSTDNTVTYDGTPPVIACGAADDLWHPENVSIACTASDATAGLKYTADASFSLSTSVVDGTEISDASTDSKIVADLAGNTATAGPISGNKIDKKSPVVSCGAADGAWHAADVSIACTATDGGSGLASASDAAFDLTTNVAAGTEPSSAVTNSHNVADAVANQVTAGPISGNKVDKKAPVVTLTCPLIPVVLNASATASWTATDGGSGVLAAYASGTIPLDASSAGPKTATAGVGTAKDIVDNSSAAANCSYSVAYVFSGLSAPVDKPNTMNLSKAGQAVPLKWRLTDANGDPVLNFSAAALGVAVTGMVCTVNASLDQIEEYAGNSGLQNLGDGYYQFNWKTPGSYANSCKSIGLNLGEGTPRGPLAYFNFKK
jgi:hypothetical protein